MVELQTSTDSFNISSHLIQQPFFFWLFKAGKSKRCIFSSMQKLTSCVPCSCTHATSCAPHLSLSWLPCVSIAHYMHHFAMPLSLHMSHHHAPYHHICHLTRPLSPHMLRCCAPHS